MKKKLTLSIDEDVIKRAKSALVLKNKTLSEIVEERLLSIYASNEMDNAMRNSGLECRYVNPDDIRRKRSNMKLTNSSETIREMRDEMNERIP